ncbi:LysR family transcriptional regulator [Cupriavidus basilensis OR16]|uniref:LysR family transcriptional regulator n=1 Tax=Cupriavidus basilensis OR16 TaxID=1127483 RepID=H1SAN4_9BURK|nr:LysR family transcriptional regulator [Cupriavidus basilensis]EHP40353.1 LysR family transcriptional regulator [Cupriavidus basilensis OR16]
MDLRQLRYFVAVAEELHFGRAAERLAITQPPLSFNIRQLETSLGFELLRRSTREVALTPAGRVMYQEAVKILALARDAQGLAGRAAKGETGTVHVGFVGSAMLTNLAVAIRAFAQERPGVEVVVHELNSFEQIDALQRGLIDIGLAHPRVLPAGLVSHVLHAERFICVLPASHALAAQAEVDLRQLQQEAFVLFPRHFAPEYHDKIVALCMGAGFTPSIRHEVRHMLTIATLVSQNFGVSLVPASVQLVQLPNLACRPLARPGRASELHGVWRADELAPAVLALLAALEAGGDGEVLP